ncbi:flagellar hook-basal body complex protein FliE [Alkalihalobacillus deserti]|uniref:flagellar hook-basal body complex protein FliE n=1 Tax=Alkalihalobacillus deserti TaxID=2879466 RepID=UPI001D15ACBB|nr:flagellar hook-basal body complex protein FliE [Alkalihalobacillus deserti]
MNITGIQSPFLIDQAANQSKPKVTPAEAQATFKTALSQAIKDVNELQKTSAEKTELLTKGEIDNLHDVMITGQKASITLQATVEVRNKVVEAYQEIMRMQV